MPNILETQPSASPWVNRLIVTLLSASLLAAAAAGLGVWKQSALIDQRITAIDNKYIEKSGRVIKRIDVLAVSLGQHLADDNAHKLVIQRAHLNFESFMKALEDAHKDIETLKHRCDMTERLCCEARSEFL